MQPLAQGPNGRQEPSIQTCEAGCECGRDPGRENAERGRIADWLSVRGLALVLAYLIIKVDHR